MRSLITAFLSLIIFLGCNKNTSNEKVTSADSTSLKLLAEFQMEVPEPSGLVYNSKTNSLFTVSDGNSTVYEIDFTGKILSLLKIDNVDLEGIAFSGNCDTMYVVDEAYQLVAKYLSTGKKLNSFPLHVATNKDHSLEGITLDNENNLMVVNEKLPCLLLKLNGTQEISRTEIESVKDCADITYDKELDCFWLISDESRKIVRLSKSCETLSEHSLPFRKGEGIAIVKDKIYIVNDDESKLYVFQKP